MIGKVILICGSSGGISFLEKFLEHTRNMDDTAVVAVYHFPPSREDLLTERMSRIAPGKVFTAEHGIQMKAGNVYIASGGYHLLLEDDNHFALDSSEPVHYCRPAADVSLESFSFVLKDKLIAVIVSGANNDGGAGAFRVHKRGGLVIVQDPGEAEFSQMPQSVITSVGKDCIQLKAGEIIEYFQTQGYI